LSDCTYDQIALALNVPPKSVGNALQRIRNKLKLRD
ncbi:MAG TPA: RNA polymerase subunit sigma-70, partial [Clostridiales bacterium]|nr:RNA polymerase subunit sigma-70 [Clostridiales bacterium]